MRALRITLFAVALAFAADAGATYVQPTTNRVADTSFEQYALVKFSTTANHVTTLLRTDNPALAAGVAQAASSGSGQVVAVQALQGLSTSMVSDGALAISPGDLVDISITTDGRVTKAPNSPYPDSNTLCVAQTAAAAVAGTVFTCNTASGKTVGGPAVYVLQFPAGQITNVNHSRLWTSSQSLTAAGPFFWEAWSESDSSSSGYVVSDGYGPDHAILFGYNGANSLTGNVWSGTGIQSVSCDDGPQVGEWNEMAMAGDGSVLYFYMDGVPCGVGAYSARIASANGALYIGGSDHNNLFGKIAAIRGFEGAAPYSAYSYQTAYRPDRFFNNVILGNTNLTSNLAFSVDYTRPAAIVSDYGLYSGASHPGQLENGFELDKGNTDWPLFTTPIPRWVLDSKCPLNPINPPPTTDWGYTPPTPPAPPGGAIVYDSFSRADQTLANTSTNVPTLGSTELGNLTWQYAVNTGPMTGTTNIYNGIPWGIFKGKAVSLLRANAWNQDVAWVDLSALGAGHNDMTVSINRRISGNTTDTYYGWQDGIVFRWRDYQNYCYAAYAGTWGCYSAGVLTAFTTWVHSTTDTTLKVIASGTSLSVLSNGITVATATSALNQTATGAGFQVNKQFPASMTALGRYDDFTVQ